MIICMNINSFGDRFIMHIDYDHSRSEYITSQKAIAYKEHYDEVYIIPFNVTKEFIDGVVLRGCRV